MLRNFAATFAAVTLRSWLVVLILVQLPLREPMYHGDFDALFQVAYVSSPWLAWIPNVAFVEWYPRRRRGRPAGPGLGRPPAAPVTG